ncbi:MAG: ABC transporter ATP-binding protein [Promethearchaeota archaeon]
MSNFALRTQGLVKKFGDLVAVNQLKMELRQGEIYGFLGPNGSGKTTAINCFMGILRPDAGEIEVLGYEIPKDRRIARQHIGLMPQEFGLYADLTVIEHLYFFGELYGFSRKEIKSNADELLDVFGLEEKRNERVINLSGGMKRRTSLCVALIHHPLLILADEPTVGVSPELRMEMWEYFRKLQKENCTFLVTTHVFDEAMKVDRIGFISEGKLIEEGVPSNLIEKHGCSNLEEVFLKLEGVTA